MIDSINATDIDDFFSKRRDAQGLLPLLLCKLILASVERENLRCIRFPSEDQVGQPGYDGVVEVEISHPYVPEGASGWEMSTESDINSKASADYDKRTGTPGSLSVLAATFIFVTPRNWRGKASWVESKRQRKEWLTVNALDATDLATWLNLTPAVERWLAGKTGMQTAMRTLPGACPAVKGLGTSFELGMLKRRSFIGLERRSGG